LERSRRNPTDDRRNESEGHMTTPLVAPPYGREVSATDRIYRGRLVSGNRLLAEAAFRRVITQRGAVLDDPNYGLPLVDLLNKPLTADELAAIPGRIRNEISKDTRLVQGSVVVDVIPIVATGVAREYEVSISADGGNGPFTLVLSVNDLTVSVLSLPEAA
jgi:hypothetical protein